MMVILELSHQAFVINGRVVEFPLPVSILGELLGGSRSCEKPQNTIYTWDELGLVAYSKDGKQAQSLCLMLRDETFDFSPSNIFQGQFLLNGVDVTNYLRKHRDQLTKIYDTDSFGGFIIGGIAVWFDVDDDEVEDIQAIEISPQTR